MRGETCSRIEFAGAVLGRTLIGAGPAAASRAPLRRGRLAGGAPLAARRPAGGQLGAVPGAAQPAGPGRGVRAGSCPTPVRASIRSRRRTLSTSVPRSDPAGPPSSWYSPLHQGAVEPQDEGAAEAAARAGSASARSTGPGRRRRRRRAAPPGGRPMRRRRSAMRSRSSPRPGRRRPRGLRGGVSSACSRSKPAMVQLPAGEQPVEPAGRLVEPGPSRAARGRGPRQ